MQLLGVSNGRRNWYLVFFGVLVSNVFTALFLHVVTVGCDLHCGECKLIISLLFAFQGWLGAIEPIFCDAKFILIPRFL